MGKRNLNLELFVVVSWMNSWVSPFIIPDIICFGFFTLDTRMVKFFMKLGVKFHSFFLEKKGEIFVPFTLFEKWKWNENDWKSRSRSESEIKMTRDRDREVKFQKNSREFSRIETLAGHWAGGNIWNPTQTGIRLERDREGGEMGEAFLQKEPICIPLGQPSKYLKITEWRIPTKGYIAPALAPSPPTPLHK